MLLEIIKYLKWLFLYLQSLRDFWKLYLYRFKIHFDLKQHMNFIDIILDIEIRLRTYRNLYFYNDEKTHRELEELIDLIQLIKSDYKNKNLKNYQQNSKLFFIKLNEYHIDFWQ